MSGRALTIDITTRDQQTLAALKRIQRELGQLDKSIDTTAQNSDKLSKSAEEYGRRLEQARERAGQITLGATVATLGAATVAAGNLAQAQERANNVFKDSVDTVNEFADGATDALGLSERQALETTSTFGNLFTQLGLGTDQAAEMSKAMVVLGGDFAAFHDANPVDVIEAQTAAFRGEYDALQRFVPTINAAAVQKRALADTGKTNAASLTEQEKALATYAIMLESAGDAEGAAAREADTLAGQMLRARGEIENAGASIGTALVPVVAEAAGGVAWLANSFGMLPGPLQTGIVGVGGLALGVGLLAPKLREAWQVTTLGVSKIREMGAATDTTAGKVKSAAAGVGVLSGALLAGAAAWQQWGQAGQAAAGDWVSKFDQANGRTVDGLRTTAAEAREFAAAMDESSGWVDGLPDIGDALDIDYNKSTREARSAAEAKAKAFEDAADRVEEAARQTGMSVEEVDEALAAAGVDPMIMSTEKLVAALERNDEAATDAAAAVDEGAAAAARAAAASAAAADAQERQAESAERARSAADAYRQAEDQVSSAQEAVVSARARVVDAERAVADARRGVEQASKGVADAERGLADARAGAEEAARDLADAEREQREGSEALRDAQEQVADAERDLAQAQRDSLTAQEDLTRARETAIERLERMRAALADDFEIRQAQLALDQARARQAELDQPGRDGEAREVSALDRRSAALSVESAERRLKDMLKDRAEAERELAEEEAKGVEGSAEVVAAKEAVEDAAENEQAAQERLTEAHGAVAEAQEQMAARVVEAQARVQEANDRVRDAADRVRDAVDGVRDAQQRVVDQQAAVVEARGAVAAAEDEVTEALVAQAIAQEELNTALANSKGALDEQIVKLLELAGQMEPGSPVRQRLMEMAEELNALTARPWTIHLRTSLVAADAVAGVGDSALELLDRAVGGRAIGGAVGPGWRGPVGEDGPEILELGPTTQGRVLTPEQDAAEQRQAAAFAERESRRAGRFGAGRGAMSARDVSLTFQITEAHSAQATADATAAKVLEVLDLEVAH